MKALAIAIPLLALIMFTAYIVYEESFSSGVAHAIESKALVVLASSLKFNGTYLTFRLVNNLDESIVLRSITLISNSWGSLTIQHFNGSNIVPGRKAVIYRVYVGSVIYSAVGGRKVKDALVPVKVRVSYEVSGKLRYTEYITYIRINAS